MNGKIPKIEDIPQKSILRKKQKILPSCKLSSILNSKQYEAIVTAYSDISIAQGYFNLITTFPHFRKSKAAFVSIFPNVLRPSRRRFEYYRVGELLSKLENSEIALAEFTFRKLVTITYWTQAEQIELLKLLSNQNRKSLSIANFSLRKIKVLIQERLSKCSNL